jgi:hypothetical protein
MRWFVEVAEGSYSTTERWVVEAAHWQPALKAARSLRGDEGELTGYSVELLEDGFRAIDPSTLTRYVVRQAPEDTPLSKPRADTNGHPAANHAPQAVALPLTHAVGGAEQPVPLSQPIPRQAPTSSPPARAAHASVSVQTASVQSVPHAQAAVPLSQPIARAHSSSVPPPPSNPLIGVSKTPAATSFALQKPVVSAVGSAPETGPHGNGNEPLPPAELLYQREEDASASSPLTYRESAWLVPEGTSADAATRLLLGTFEGVRAALAGLGPGKLVNMAVFDHRFEGKPLRPPLVTLSWKDWQDQGQGPELRRPSARPSSMPAPAPAPDPGVRPAPPPAVAPAEAAVPEPPAPAAVSEPAPPTASSGSATPAEPPPAAAAPTAAAASSEATPAPAAPVSTPLPPRRRLVGEELIADLFEAMHDLHFLRDPNEGADFVLSLLMDKLPSHAGLVHFYDIDTREFVVVRSVGPGAGNVRGSRTSEKESVVADAMRKRRSVVIGDTRAEGTELGARWSKLDLEVHSLVCAPVELAGRFLGLLELCNPRDGAAFGEGDGHALTYIGEQFAEFLAARTIVIEPKSVRPR